MPVFAFGLWELGVQLGGDHVLNANELGIRAGPVVEDTLPHIRGQVGAVMVCLHMPTGLVGVGVEGVQMGTDILDGLETLRRD